MRGALVTALALALAPSTLGCEPGRAASSTVPVGATASSPPMPTGSAPVVELESKLRARAVVAGYGGVGPATPAPHPDTWVVLFVDVEATAALTGVEVKELELTDAAGNVIARAAPPWSLRIDPRTVTDEARQRDFSDFGTTPFDGSAQPGRGLRLRVHAPLDARAASLKPHPVRFRALIVASGDPGVRVEGALQGPWPTG